MTDMVLWQVRCYDRYGAVTGESLIVCCFHSFILYVYCSVRVGYDTGKYTIPYNPVLPPPILLVPVQLYIPGSV